MMDPDTLALAEIYRAAGLSYHAIAKELGCSHTHVRRSLLDSDALDLAEREDPELKLHQATWRCQCSRRNVGPNACACGRKPHWVEADEATTKTEHELKEAW